MDKLPLRQPCDAYPWFNIVYTFGQLMALCVAGLRLARQRPTGPTRTLLPVHHLGRPFQVRPDSDLTSESGPTRTSPRVRLRRCIWPYYADVASGPTRKSLSLHARLGLGRRLVSESVRLRRCTGIWPYADVASGHAHAVRGGPGSTDSPGLATC